MLRPLLSALHWLPVKDRIIFKTNAFVFFFLWGGGGVWYEQVPATIAVIVYILLSIYSSHALSSSDGGGGGGGEEKEKSSIWELNGFGYQSFSVQALLVCSRQTSLLASDTAVLSHS